MLSCRFSPSIIILVISLRPSMLSWNSLLIADFPALSKHLNCIINNAYGHSLITRKYNIHNLKLYWFMGGFDLQSICQIKSAECRGKVFPDDNLLGRLWSRR